MSYGYKLEPFCIRRGPLVLECLRQHWVLFLNNEICGPHCLDDLIGDLFLTDIAKCSGEPPRYLGVASVQ